ncbi:MAG: GGDEF domain-containing protein, partial [Sulfurimonas sp.]
GFRNGDRIIQLFADILQKHLPTEFFKGHIGGDDFFVCSKVDKVHYEKIKNIIDIFAAQAKTFYSKEDRKRGYIISHDREGKEKKFPMLNVSASVLFVNCDKKSKYTNHINNILSLQKKIAKKDPNKLAASCLL